MASLRLFRFSSSHSTASRFRRSRPSFLQRRLTTQTQSSTSPSISAAPPIDLSSLPPPTATYARIVPESPSYFTGAPQYTDDLLHLATLLRRHSLLPTVPSLAAPRMAWHRLADYRRSMAEPVRASKYSKILAILKRLNRIHPTLMPTEVADAIESHRRPTGPLQSQLGQGEVDSVGRSYGAGRRKSSTARAWLVEGVGEVRVNGRLLSDAFRRLHDRESAIWALKSTGRCDKYNVWVKVEGGGTTGQAEAVTLAVGKALLVHEPALKPALRRAGCLTRDPKRVERKKPGHVKARKMPTWTKR